MPSAAKQRGSLKQVSLKNAAAGLMSRWASSQSCDYWRLASLICVIPIFFDSVRALGGTTVSGSLPKPSWRKGQVTSPSAVTCSGTVTGRFTLPLLLFAPWSTDDGLIIQRLMLCASHAGVTQLWLNIYKKALKNSSKIRLLLAHQKPYNDHCSASVKIKGIFLIHLGLQVRKTSLGYFTILWHPSHQFTLSEVQELNVYVFNTMESIIL